MKTIIRRLLAPSLFFLLFSGMLFLSDYLIPKLGIAKLETNKWLLDYIVQILLWLSAAFLTNRLVHVFLWDRRVVRTIGENVPRLLKEVVTIIIYVIAITGIVGFVFKKPVTGIWATSGAVGIVLGFALRNMILDVFSGIATNIDEPYRIGDWIMIHASNREQNIIGQVMEVNWRATRIKSEANNIVIVPNSVLGSMIVTNFRKPTPETRFEVSFILDFSIPTDRARRILLAGVKAVTGQNFILESPEPQAIVAQATSLGIEYQVRYWILPWSDGIVPPLARNAVVCSILEHLRKAGITPAYPKQDLYYEPMPVRHLHEVRIEDRKKLLAAIELFQNLEETEIEKLASNMKRSFYRQGETLIRTGDAGSSMFILMEGLLHVFSENKDTGLEEKVGQVGPGQFFGEMSLLTGEPRSATVISATDAVTYEITKEHVVEIIGQRPEIAEEISRIIAERRLRTQQAFGKVSRQETMEQTKSLARQILGKIRFFFRGNA